MSLNMSPQPMLPLRPNKPTQFSQHLPSKPSPHSKSKGRRTISSRSNSHSSSSSPQNGNEYELQKLRKRVRELHKKQAVLRMQMSSLENQCEFSEQKSLKAEEKNRQLIQKLSFQQVQSRQLKFILAQLQQQRNGWQSRIEEIRAEYMELQSTHAKLKDNHTSVTVLLKSIMELLSRARTESVERAMGRIRELMERGARFVEGGLESHGQSVVTNFEISSKGVPTTEPSSSHSSSLINTLQKQNQQLKQSLQSTKQHLQKQRSDKRRILPAYNQILNKLRQSCSALKMKVEQIYNRSQRDKQNLQSLVAEKDDLIMHLQGKNEELLGLLKKTEQRERVLAERLAQGSSARGSRVGVGVLEKEKQRDREREREKQREREREREKEKDRSISEPEELSIRELEHPSHSRSKKGSASNANYIGDWKKVKIKKDLENIDDQIQNIIDEIQNAQK